MPKMKMLHQVVKLTDIQAHTETSKTITSITIAVGKKAHYVP